MDSHRQPVLQVHHALLHPRGAQVLHHVQRRELHEGAHVTLHHALVEVAHDVGVALVAQRAQHDHAQQPQQLGFRPGHRDAHQLPQLAPPTTTMMEWRVVVLWYGGGGVMGGVMVVWRTCVV